MEDAHTSESDCPCPMHARHWTPLIQAQILSLRREITKVFMTTFFIIPTVELHKAILSASSHDPSIEKEMDATLFSMSDTSADALAMTLIIQGQGSN